MAFKKIGEADLFGSPKISILPHSKGRSPRMRLSPSAFQFMGAPVAVHFEWDDDDSLLRIVASSPDDPAAFLVGTERRITIPRLLDVIGVEITRATDLPVRRDGPLSAIADLSEYRSRHDRH